MAGVITEIAIECGVSEQAAVSYTHLDVYKRQIQVLDIDSNKPFAIVLPISAGTITFYDVNGNTVEYWNNSL